MANYKIVKIQNDNITEVVFPTLKLARQHIQVLIGNLKPLFRLTVFPKGMGFEIDEPATFYHIEKC